MTDLEKAIELARKKACEWLRDWLESEDSVKIPITESSIKSFLKEFKKSMKGDSK